jgi:tetratricopeptide (TPR) repeat protein
MPGTTFKLLFFVCLSVWSLAVNAQYAEAEIKNFIGRANQEADDNVYIKIISSADSFARTVNSIVGRARINQAAAAHFYATDGNRSILYQQEAFRLYNEVPDKEGAATCLQNMAFTYEEQLNDYENALKFGLQALDARIEMKDTMEWANMAKYVSFVHGKLHNFEQAKFYAGKAMELYQLKSYVPGLAVTYRNLAIVFEEQKRYDSSIALLLRARAIWQTMPENTHICSFRIYGCHNDLIRVYTKAGKLKDAGDILAENEKTDGTVFHHTAQIGFLKEARDYYIRKKDKENTKIYTDKYNAMSKKLRAEGYKVD